MASIKVIEPIVKANDNGHGKREFDKNKKSDGTFDQVLKQSIKEISWQYLRMSYNKDA